MEDYMEFISAKTQKELLGTSMISAIGVSDVEWSLFYKEVASTNPDEKILANVFLKIAIQSCQRWSFDETHNTDLVNQMAILYGIVQNLFDIITVKKEKLPQSPTELRNHLMNLAEHFITDYFLGKKTEKVPNEELSQKTYVLSPELLEVVLFGNDSDDIEESDYRKIKKEPDDNRLIKKHKVIQNIDDLMIDQKNVTGKSPAITNSKKAYYETKKPLTPEEIFIQRAQTEINIMGKIYGNNNGLKRVRAKVRNGSGNRSKLYMLFEDFIMSQKYEREGVFIYSEDIPLDNGGAKGKTKLPNIKFYNKYDGPIPDNCLISSFVKEGKKYDVIAPTTFKRDLKIIKVIKDWGIGKPAVEFEVQEDGKNDA
jgi:hypothetical protein